MKVYLAAKYSRREEMETLAKELPKIGHRNVSSWVYGVEELMDRPAIAVMDLQDVSYADIIILFTHPRGEPQPGGGRFVEFGWALAQGKRCVVVGPKENIFMDTPGVEVYDTWEEFFTHEMV